MSIFLTPNTGRIATRLPASVLRLAGAALILILGTLLAAVPVAQAQGRIININAGVSGCGSNGGACDNAADHLPPGAQFRLISPLNVTLEAGTYRITHAGAKARFQGWRYDGGAHWVWNFGIAVNNGRSKGTLLYVAVADGVYPSSAVLASSKGAVRGGSGGPNAKLPVVARSGGPRAFTDTFTLKSRTRLSFFILDYDVSDNAGGVSLRLEPVPK